MKAAVCAGVSAIFLSAAALAQVRDTRPPTPPPPPPQQARDVAAPAAGKAVLSGTVVTDEQAPQPIKRAQISLSNTDLTVTRTTFTNDSGKFTITGLPAGRYTLAASKAPYLRTNYGAKRYDRPGTPITLKDAEQMANLTLRMTRGAVLSGTITDENGAPASGVSVRALQLRVQNGERTFVSVASAGTTIETTDDRGMYRFFGLPPGDYTVNAQPRMTSGEIKAMTESEIRAVMQALAQQTAQTPGTGTPAAGATAARSGCHNGGVCRRLLSRGNGRDIRFDCHDCPGRGAPWRGLSAEAGAHGARGRNHRAAAGRRATGRADHDDADDRGQPGRLGRRARDPGDEPRGAWSGRQVPVHRRAAWRIHDQRARQRSG
jgi:uncharacterized protein (DUF2141 family)